MSYFAYLASFLSIGSFVFIDLIAATTNALNGALLAQRPDYYKGRQWSIVGILILAVFGGIGGGVSRDVLLNKIPGALTNPWYLILCLIAGGVLAGVGVITTLLSFIDDSPSKSVALAPALGPNFAGLTMNRVW